MLVTAPACAVIPTIFPPATYLPNNFSGDMPLFNNDSSMDPKCRRVKNGRGGNDSNKKDINSIPPMKQGLLGTSLKKGFLNEQPTPYRKLFAKEKGKSLLQMEEKQESIIPRADAVHYPDFYNFEPNKSPLGESSWCDTGDPPIFIELPDKHQTHLSYSRAELLDIRVLNPLPISSLSMKKEQKVVLNNLIGEMKHDKRDLHWQNHYHRIRKKTIIRRDFILLNKNLSKSLKTGQKFQFYHHQSCSRVIIGVKKVANLGEASANGVGVSISLAESGRGEEDDHVATEYNNVAAKDERMAEVIEDFSNEVAIGCSSPEIVITGGVPNKAEAGGSPFPRALNMPIP